MALDDFVTGNNNTDTSNDTNKKVTKSTTDVEIECDEELYENTSIDKDLNAEYEETCFKECWRCGNRKVELAQLSQLGKLWWCENKKCKESIAHAVEESASSKDIAEEIDVSESHRIISKEDLNPRNMGLDDFTSGSSSSTTDDSSTTTEDEDTEDESTTTRSGGGDVDSLGDTDLSFYGTGDADVGVTPMKRKGAMSNFSTSRIMENVEAPIHIEEDHIKYHLPIFTTITSEKEYEQGKIYVLSHTADQPKASWNSKPVVCIGQIETQLGKMNKELAMFEAGSPSKKHVMERIETQLDQETSGSTDVRINVFGDMFNLRDLAQANTEFKEGKLINRDDVANRVLRPKDLKVTLENEE
jgi:hypothetical protein